MTGEEPTTPWGSEPTMPAAPPTSWGPPGPPSRGAPSPPSGVRPPGGPWGAPPPAAGPAPRPSRARPLVGALAVVLAIVALSVGMVVADPMGIRPGDESAASWRAGASDEDLAPDPSAPDASAEAPAGAGGSSTTTTTTQPPTTTTAPPTRLAPAPTPPAEPGFFAFLGREGDGDPVTWDPCETIQYVVNTRRAPAGAGEMLAEAIAAVTAASGLVFEDRGLTDEPPSPARPLRDVARYGDDWSPVLISWTDPEEWPRLVEEDASGFGGLQWVPTGGGEMEGVTGEIQLDGAWAAARLELGGRSDIVHLLMHEIGHLIGLDHVDDISQVMYGGDDGAWPTRWRDGDLAGLAAAGTGDCDPDV